MLSISRFSAVSSFVNVENEAPRLTSRAQIAHDASQKRSLARVVSGMVQLLKHDYTDCVRRVAKRPFLVPGGRVNLRQKRVAVLASLV